MQDELLKMLKDSGAIITDSHIVGTSGKHMSVYINKDALYPHTSYASRVGEMFAEINKALDIDVTVGPSLGGIILSQWTAYHLSKMKGREILGVYTEKDSESNQIFKRGYDKLVAGKNVLVLEDITNTGGSLVKVLESVKNAGGEIVSASVIVNRNPQEINSEELGVPFHPLLTYPAQAWDAEECELCKQGMPINTSVGHGAKFLAEQKKK